MNKQFSKWNETRLKELQVEGKIRGFRIPENNCKKSVNNSKSVQQLFVKRSKEKDWLNWNLSYWCNENAVTLELEYQFHPQRKWRFDWVIPALKIAIEYEGIFSAKSRHTTVNGYNGDVEKYNHATVFGWKVIRLTAKNYLNVFVYIKEIVECS